MKIKNIDEYFIVEMNYIGTDDPENYKNKLIKKSSCVTPFHQVCREKL